jgi:hypothetical protein
MTLGVIILLEGSLILFSSTSIGSSVVVSALRRLTSSMQRLTLEWQVTGVDMHTC